MQINVKTTQALLELAQVVEDKVSRYESEYGKYNENGLPLSAMSYVKHKQIILLDNDGTQYAQDMLRVGIPEQEDLEIFPINEKTIVIAKRYFVEMIDSYFAVRREQENK